MEAPADETFREIPSPKLWWNSAYWINETGTLRKRFYNPRTKEWVWGDIVNPISRKDRVGYCLHGQFRSVEQAIALAWVRRKAPMRRMRRVSLRDPTAGVIAYNLFYCDEDGASSEEEEEEEPQEDLPDEEWRHFKCKLGVVECRSTGFQVSSMGRIRSPDGVITRGVAALGLSRYCQIPSIGFIPIQATQKLFGDKRYDSPPPRIRNLLILLKNSDDSTIDSLSKRLRLKDSSVWTYVNHAMRYVSTETARDILMKLLQKQAPLCDVVEHVINRQPLFLTSRLKPLVEIVSHELAADPDWKCNPFRYSEVAALKMLLQRES